MKPIRSTKRVLEVIRIGRLKRDRTPFTVIGHGPAPLVRTSLDEVNSESSLLCTANEFGTNVELTKVLYQTVGDRVVGQRGQKRRSPALHGDRNGHVQFTTTKCRFQPTGNDLR